MPKKSPSSSASSLFIRGATDVTMDNAEHATLLLRLYQQPVGTFSKHSCRVFSRRYDDNAKHATMLLRLYQQPVGTFLQHSCRVFSRRYDDNVKHATLLLRLYQQLLGTFSQQICRVLDACVIVFVYNLGQQHLSSLTAAKCARERAMYSYVCWGAMPSFHLLLRGFGFDWLTAKSRHVHLSSDRQYETHCLVDNSSFF